MVEWGECRPQSNSGHFNFEAAVSVGMSDHLKKSFYKFDLPLLAYSLTLLTALKYLLPN